MSGPSVRHHSPMTAADSTQTVTVNWVRNWFGPISRLASVSQILEGTVQTVRCTVPPANSESFAWRLAVGIAPRKLALRPDLFVTWLGVAAGCFDKATVPPDSFSRMVDRGILVNVGEPGGQAHDSHFYGLIGEAVLHEVLWDGTHGQGAAGDRRGSRLERHRHWRRPWRSTQTQETFAFGCGSRRVDMGRQTLVLWSRMQLSSSARRQPATSRDSRSQRLARSAMKGSPPSSLTCGPLGRQ